MTVLCVFSIKHVAITSSKYWAGLLFRQHFFLPSLAFASFLIILLFDITHPVDILPEPMQLLFSTLLIFSCNLWLFCKTWTVSYNWKHQDLPKLNCWLCRLLNITCQQVDKITWCCQVHCKHLFSASSLHFCILCCLGKLVWTLQSQICLQGSLHTPLVLWTSILVTL